MAQYIDKSALVEEIERRLKETESMQPKFDQFWAGQISAFKGALKIINTLETKEVGLDRKDVAEKAKNFATKDLVYCLSSPREKCVTCYNWLTQEDVGPNDFPQCSENKSSCRDYLLGYSDTCSYYIDL